MPVKTEAQCSDMSTVHDSHLSVSSIDSRHVDAISITDRWHPLLNCSRPNMSAQLSCDHICVLCQGWTEEGPKVCSLGQLPHQAPPNYQNSRDYIAGSRVKPPHHLHLGQIHRGPHLPTTHVPYIVGSCVKPPHHHGRARVRYPKATQGFTNLHMRGRAGTLFWQNMLSAYYLSHIERELFRSLTLRWLRSTKTNQPSQQQTAG